MATIDNIIAASRLFAKPEHTHCGGKPCGCGDKVRLELFALLRDIVKCLLAVYQCIHITILLMIVPPPPAPLNCASTLEMLGSAQFTAFTYRVIPTEITRGTKWKKSSPSTVTRALVMPCLYIRCPDAHLICFVCSCPRSQTSSHHPTACTPQAPLVCRAIETHTLSHCIS